MSLQQYREVLRSELLRAGFERQTIAESPLENVDLGLTTPCFQAFFKVVGEIDTLEHTWRTIQDTIANYKTENTRAPRDLYLAFLLLNAVDAAQLPLIQTISADTMVCRKLLLPTDPDHMSIALGSLPFMSMGVGTARPAPSLQDVFGAMGTRDYPMVVLDILSERASAERILTRLMELPVPSEIPQIASASLNTAGSQAMVSTPCRLEALEVRNFRGIVKAEIDVSANITIIYGQNGTGKTSFFDAIEWALVGNVERLDAENKDDTSGRSPYVNLFAHDPTSVSTTVSIENVLTTITRICQSSGESHLLVDDRQGADDREALALIIGEQSTKLDLRILRRLVRTTCFLSQSTLKSFLSDDPKERYWSLSHLLGTQDYVRLLERIEEVNRIIDHRVHEFDGRLEQLSTDSESIRVQIRSREALISEAVGAQELDRMLASLVTEASNKLSGLQSPYTSLFPANYGAYDAQSSIAIASDWVDKEFRQARDTKEKLLLAIDASNRRFEVIAAIQDLSRRKSELSAAFERLNAELIIAEEEKSRAELELAQLTAKRDRLMDVRSKQREALVIAQQMEGLKASITEQQNQLADVESESSSSAATRAQRAEELTRATTTNQRNVDDAMKLRDEIRALDEAESLGTTYRQLALELPSLEQTIRDTEASIAEQQHVAADLRTRNASIEREIAALSSERERQMGSVETLRGLLADIQKYLVDPECPLCGHEWHSTEELKHAVDERTSWLSPKVKQLDEQLLQMHQRLTSSQKTLVSAEEAAAQTSARRNDALRRSEEIKNIGSRLRELLVRAGLPTDSDARSLRLQKEAKTGEITRITELVAQGEGALARLRDELNRLDSDAVRKEEARQRIASRLADTRRRMNDLVAQLEAFGSGFDKDLTLLQQQSQEISREIEVTESIRTSALEKATAAESTLEEKKTAAASEERGRAENERSIAALTEALKRVDYTLSDAKLDTGVSSEVIRSRIQNVDDRIRGLDDARSTLNRLNEISSWLIGRREILELNSKLASINTNDEGIRTERSTLLEWNSHLEKLYVALVDIKAEVEALQLENYGPTINLLYQRLNTHPIFTELKVSVDAPSQSVKVHLALPVALQGNGELIGLSPARYLSEAQLNVAALSIFLSHSFQQRWSSFEPLFLDDPVQNMDDFNANGFIDCLRSLAAYDRQFIVSTCNLSLYRLLLLKLRCMNYDGHVRFRAYRLEGISEQGPRIVQDFPTTDPVISSHLQVVPDRIN